MCKFEEEIRLAKEEMATWSDIKKSSVQLEGIDKYFIKEQQGTEHHLSKENNSDEE